MFASTQSYLRFTVDTYRQIYETEAHDAGHGVSSPVVAHVWMPPQPPPEVLVEDFRLLIHSHDVTVQRLDEVASRYLSMRLHLQEGRCTVEREMRDIDARWYTFNGEDGRRRRILADRKEALDFLDKTLAAVIARTGRATQNTRTGRAELYGIKTRLGTIGGAKDPLSVGILLSGTDTALRRLYQHGHAETVQETNLKGIEVMPKESQEGALGRAELALHSQL